MASRSTSGAIRALQVELKALMEQPVEGFTVQPDQDNLFEWIVAIFGPPGTLYEGGYFKAQMKFPQDYPYSPPTVRFLSKMWHPNIYENGDVCISILHPPVDDPRSGELPSERWNPTQSVRTVLLSIISLLNEPNTSSPANVDASVMYRRWKDAAGKEKDYENIIKKQVSLSRTEAERDGVRVPTTLEEYCASRRIIQEPGDADLAAAITDSYSDDDGADFAADSDYTSSNDDGEDDGDEDTRSALDVIPANGSD